jgi:polyisoprenoid-binding protein YceI
MALTILLILLAAACARAERWQVAAQGGEVVFTSKAPLETFKGRTGLIRGWIDWNPADLTAPLDGEIVVDLASLDTGKNKRNEHMRDNHLETDRFPTATLRPVVVLSDAPSALPPGSEADIRLRGTFDLHGVTRTLECDVHLRRDGVDAVTVTTEFPVLLSDHDIERPKFLVMKLADEQQVSVTFKLQPAISP